LKLTNEIVKALQGAIEEGYESVSDFARQANVSGNTITKYLRKETASITDDTWRKIHPLIRPFLPGGRRSEDSHHRPEDLDTDQKVLLDMYAELPKDVQKKKIEELVALAQANGGVDVVAHTEQKTLLRALGELPKDMRKAKIVEFVALATDELKRRRERSSAK